MEHRLFRVIVLGGAALVAACGGSVEPRPEAGTATDAAEADDSSDPMLRDGVVDASPVVDAGDGRVIFPGEAPTP